MERHPPEVSIRSGKDTGDSEEAVARVAPSIAAQVKVSGGGTEQGFRSEEEKMQVTNSSIWRREPETYDVVVIGGGAAGLGGALMLGRSRRSVLLVDAGEPRNAPASGVHGFLTRDGMAPAALLEAGRTEVRGYGVRVLDGRVASAESGDGGFTLTLEDGRRVDARRLLVTTGLVDELPDVPGVRERWGRDVLHCPYCHGWEVRDRP